MSGKHGRCIGLIGGLGPGATVHYYQALLRAHVARQVRPNLMIAHADVGQVLGRVERGDLAGLARYFAEFIARLGKAGAQVAAIPAVTAHACMPLLKPLSPLPLIDIVEVTRSELARRALRRIAVFGTRFTVESDMFGRLADRDVIRPRADEADDIYRIYAELVAAGVGTDAHARAIRDIATRLIARDSVEAIVVAGTELALILDEGSAGFPMVDCAQLHIEAIVNSATP